MTLAGILDRALEGVGSDDENERYVLLRVGDGWYAAAVTDVREIVKPPPVTEVPGAGPGVSGVVLVHGAVLTLLDPREILAERVIADDAYTRVLVVEHEGERLGLRADEVARIVQIASAHIEPAHEIPAGAGAHVIGVVRSVTQTGDGFAVILDVAALLRAMLVRCAHFS